MKPTGLYPMIATEMLAESRDFYVGLGFAVAYDGDWYVHMAWPTNPTLQIGFITAGHPSQAPIYRTRLSGGGVFLGLEVDDVDDVYRDLTSRGHAITVTLKDEPWGQRHFGIADPNGIPIDIYTTIPPSGEFAPTEPAKAEPALAGA